MLGILQLTLDDIIVVEVQSEVFVDTLVHPILGLFVTTIVEIAISLNEVKVLVNHVPHLLDTCAVEATVAQHLRHPTAFGHGEEMQGIAEVGGSHLTTVHIIAITLVDDDAIGDFHNATLDALQLVASTSHLDEQEEVDHRVTSRLALPYSHRLNEYLVETSSLAKDDSLTSLTGYTTQRASSWTGTDER